ncbi:hypothetical protein HZA57_09195 [Candidatus Poribacteria bacterium]|nr:hypothetical protein [Candidatus Poribacteria bacterium]
MTRIDIRFRSDWLIRSRCLLEFGMLLIAAGVYFYLILSLSETYDERAFIHTGMHFLLTGSPSFHVHNPPLAGVFGIPAWRLGAPLVSEVEAPLPRENGLAMLLMGRVMAAAVYLLFAWSFGRIAGRWPGVRRGLFALMIVLFEPTLSAHAMLTTTDCLFTATAFWFLAATVEWWRSPGWLRAGLVGVTCSLAMLAKMSITVWGTGMALAVVAAGIGRLCGSSESGRAWSGREAMHMAAQLLFAVLLAFAVVGTDYGFRGVGSPIGALGFHAGGLGRVPAWVKWIPSPLPADYLRVLDELIVSLPGRVSYFHGAFRVGRGSPAYYPLLLLMKPPVPLLVLLICSAWLGVRERIWRSQLFWLLAIPPAFFLASISFGQSIQIGVRHLFPVFPLLYLAAVWGLDVVTGRLKRWTLSVLACSVALQGLWLTPHQLAYFNPLAGGPEGAWRWYSDSNQDWGQGWNSVHRYRERHPGSYNFEAVDGQTTGLVILGTNTLVGLTPERHEEYAWIRDRLTRVEFIPPCWHLYNISESDWTSRNRVAPLPDVLP